MGEGSTFQFPGASLPHSSPGKTPTTCRHSELSIHWKCWMKGKHTWETPHRWKAESPGFQALGLRCPSCRFPAREAPGYSQPCAWLGRGFTSHSRVSSLSFLPRNWQKPWLLGLFLSDLVLCWAGAVACPIPSCLKMAFVHSFAQLFDKYFLNTGPCWERLGHADE